MEVVFIMGLRGHFKVNRSPSRFCVSFFLRGFIASLMTNKFGIHAIQRLLRAFQWCGGGRFKSHIRQRQPATDLVTHSRPS